MKSKVKIIKRPNNAIRDLEKLNKRFSGPDDVRVGLPKGSNDYPDGTSVIMVGAVHELGSVKINVSARSYLRSTVNEKRNKYRQMFVKLSKQIVSGKIDKNKALNLLGQQVQTDVRQKITDIKLPPLRYREGNPLIDTGHLRQSIVYKVGL